MLGVPPRAGVPLSTPRARATDLGRGPNLLIGSGRAPCVPRSREDEEKPAAGKEKMTNGEKKAHTHICICLRYNPIGFCSILTTIQGCEPKLQSRLFRSVLSAFPHRKPTVFSPLLGCTEKYETGKPTCLFLVGFVLQPTATRKQPKPTDNSGGITKNRPNYFLFSVYLR